MAYWINNERSYETDKRGLMYEMEPRWMDTETRLHLHNGLPLTEDDKSKMYTKVTVTNCNKNAWPSAFFVLGAFIVNETVKHTIERLEPGVHEFVPLKVVDATGQVKEPLFSLHCRTRIQAVIINKSRNVVVRQRSPEVINGRLVNFPRSLQGGGAAEDLVLDSNRIAGKHLWAGPRLHFGDSYFCTDELKSALEAIDNYLRFEVVREEPGEPGDQY